MNLENRKILIIIISLLLILLISFITFTIDDKDLYVISSPNTVFTYKDGEWKAEKNKRKYNKKYEVYIDGKYQDKYRAKYNKYEKTYEFKKGFKSQNITDLFLGFRGKTKYSVENANYLETNISDYKNIEKILIDNEIEYNIPDLPIKNKLVLDMNNDNINETIYFISNTFDDTTNKKAFSLIALVDNTNNITYIHREVVGINNIYDICMPYFNSVIDVEEDKNLEIITSCAYYSNIGTKNYLFNYKNNNYNLLASNKVE